jgi:hypothetical protein
MEHASVRRDGAPIAPMASMNQMHPAAARSLAAAGLQSGKHVQEDRSYDPTKRYKDSPTEASDAVDDDIIRSQLQQSNDGLQTSMDM